MTHSTVVRPTLLSRLPQLLPLAIGWAGKLEQSGALSGKPLAHWQVADARDVGVAHPHMVRLCIVEAMPKPDDHVLAAACTEAGVLGEGTLGLTLGRTIFLRSSHVGLRWLLRHELRHVAQVEQAGGTRPFLSKYLDEVLRFGYDKAPLEIDARGHERQFAGHLIDLKNR